MYKVINYSIYLFTMNEINLTVNFLIVPVDRTVTWKQHELKPIILCRFVPVCSDVTQKQHGWYIGNAFSSFCISLYSMCSPPHKTYTYFNYKVSVYENAFNFQNLIFFFSVSACFQIDDQKKKWKLGELSAVDKIGISFFGSKVNKWISHNIEKPFLETTDSKIP